MDKISIIKQVIACKKCKKVLNFTWYWDRCTCFAVSFRRQDKKLEVYYRPTEGKYEDLVEIKDAISHR